MAMTAVIDRIAGDCKTAPDDSATVSAIRPLVEAGISVHWLKRRSKAPVEDAWQTADTQTFDELSASWRRGYNVGIRPGAFSKTEAGYLHLIDMDVRDPDQVGDAWSAVLRLWPDARQAPYVMSGSGGESRHLYFFTDQPFRSHKLAMSAGWKMVWDEKKGREVKKRDWEIELFGTNKQVALPPSLHPDTGRPYSWGREIDFDLLMFGMGPVLPSDVVAGWGATAGGDLNVDDDDLLSIVRAEPMGLSEAEIDATIADLPPEWVEDRDTWLQVGQALHHEYGGSNAGFERWCEWSKQSAKYDARNSATVWKSFRGTTRNPVRMATLIKAAAQARLERDHDIEDLLSDDPATTALALVNDDIEDLLADDVEDLLADNQSVAPGASSVSDLGPPDPQWRSYLQMSEDGTSIKPTLHNVELIIRNDPRTRGVMAFNEFTQEVVQIARPKPFSLKKAGPKPVRQLDAHIWRLDDPINGDLWSDSQDGDVRLILEAPTRQGGYSLKTSDRDLKQATDKAASLNSFHPVRSYLSGLKWDGVSRVARLFIDYVGAEDSEYHREAALLFMLGAVTRIHEPGHKFDFVPILEGLQGKRKSTFIQILGRHWSAELEGDFHDTKAMVEKMQGSWVLEIPELQGFSKAEVTTLKGFISRIADKVRMAYARRASVVKRQCVFMGSTNDAQYLRDSTGGRRFWPIACTVTEIDTDLLSANIDQMWAEAKALYNQWRQAQPRGTLPLYLKSDGAANEAKRLQESRRQHTAADTLVGEIEAVLDAPIGSELGFDDGSGPTTYRNEFCLVELWVDLLGRDRASYRHAQVQEVSQAVEKLGGWETDGRRRHPKYGQQRFYARTQPR